MTWTLYERSCKGTGFCMALLAWKKWSTHQKECWCSAQKTVHFLTYRTWRRKYCNSSERCSIWKIYYVILIFFSTIESDRQFVTHNIVLRHGSQWLWKWNQAEKHHKNIKRSLIINPILTNKLKRSSFLFTVLSALFWLWRWQWNDIEFTNVKLKFRNPFNTFQQYVAAILAFHLRTFHNPSLGTQSRSRENREVFWRLQVADKKKVGIDQPTKEGDIGCKALRKRRKCFIFLSRVC